MSKKKSNLSVAAIIEARMGSSRLPGKVLADINGLPAIQRLVNRLSFSQELDNIVLATSTSPKDDALESWANKNGISCFRGSEENVLQRVVDASNYVNCDIIVEITGDCILSDHEIIDQSIITFFENSCDVVTNCGTYLSYPMGIYTQVFRKKDLEWVSKNINDKAVQEHVSLYFYENPEKYKILNLVAPKSYSYPEWRLQLDYPEDLKLLNEIYKHLEKDYGESFLLKEICNLINKNKYLLEINSHCIEKTPR